MMEAELNMVFPLLIASRPGHYYPRPPLGGEPTPAPQHKMSAFDMSGHPGRHSFELMEQGTEIVQPVDNCTMAEYQLSIEYGCKHSPVGFLKYADSNI